MYVTEDTTRADPETLRAALRVRHPRRRQAHLPGRHRRPRHAVGRRRRWCEFAGAGDQGRRAPTSASTGTATATATWRSSTASPRSRPAPRRVHGAALGIGERVGNTPMDLLLVNLVLMGFIDRDLTPLMDVLRDGVGRVRRADPRQLSGGRAGRVPHRHRRARGGGDQGVEEGRPRADGRRSTRAIPASLVGRRAGDRSRPDVGQVERVFWLEQHGIPPSDPIVDRVFAQGEVVDDGADRSGDPGRSVPLEHPR